MPIQLIRKMIFSAAHRLPTSPHQEAQRLHGHTYAAELLLEGALDSQKGWLLDFGDVRQAFASCAEQLDHAYLNEVPGLETPSLPALKRWLYGRLKGKLPGLKRISMTILGDLDFAPRVLPKDSRFALPPRLTFSLESAHRLPNVGESHKCSRLHGHSFRVEVGADNLNDCVAALHRVHEQIDHRYLNEIAGLENPTSENLAMWIWRALRPDVSDLRVVVIRESPECACFYWGDET